jgi:hypothetical protein
MGLMVPVEEIVFIKTKEHVHDDESVHKRI